MGDKRAEGMQDNPHAEVELLTLGVKLGGAGTKAGGGLF